MRQSWRRTSRLARWIWIAAAVLIVALLWAIGARAMGLGPSAGAGHRGPRVGGANSGQTSGFQELLTMTAVGTSTATATPTLMPESTITETPTGTSTVTPLATDTPVSLQVSVISVKIEKKGSKPDWRLSRPSLRKAIAKSSVVLSIYYTTAATARSDVVRDQWLVTKNRTVVLRKGQSHRLGKPTSGLYRDHLRFKLGTRGTYVYTGRVTITGVSDAGQTSLKAVKRKSRVTLRKRR